MDYKSIIQCQIMKWSNASVASKLVITPGSTYHGSYKYNYTLPGNKTFREIKKYDWVIMMIIIMFYIRNIQSCAFFNKTISIIK